MLILLPSGSQTLTSCSFSQRRNVLSLSSGIDNPGALKWDLALCLLLVWLVCFFCIWKGVRSTGKVSGFLFPASGTATLWAAFSTLGGGPIPGHMYALIGQTQLHVTFSLTG